MQNTDIRIMLIQNHEKMNAKPPTDDYKMDFEKDNICMHVCMIYVNNFSLSPEIENR